MPAFVLVLAHMCRFLVLFVSSIHNYLCIVRSRYVSVSVCVCVCACMYRVRPRALYHLPSTLHGASNACRVCPLLLSCTFSFPDASPPTTISSSSFITSSTSTSTTWLFCSPSPVCCSTHPLSHPPHPGLLSSTSQAPTIYLSIYKCPAFV